MHVLYSTLYGVKKREKKGSFKQLKVILQLMNRAISIGFLCLNFLVLTCNSNKNSVKEDTCSWDTLSVTATAYNSLKYQTDNQSHITAFGDTLKPNQKCIAISRDLMALGITHNTQVAIEGFEGLFRVNDKMHWRWKKRIDIYMGEDVQAAKQWGKQKVTIAYCLKNTNKNSLAE